MASLSRDNLKTMLIHHLTGFNKHRDLLTANVSNFTPEKLTDHEKDSALVSINLMKKEIEALEQFVIEHQSIRP